jgi:hypothetical protein
MITEEKDLKNDLLDLVPKDGKLIGNVTLIERFTKNTKKSIDEYWKVRNELINEGILGKGKGKGGSVYLIIVQSEVPLNVTLNENQKIKEQKLYAPFLKTLNTFWTKDNDLTNYIIEITANQGSRETGGKWTRPDITLIDIKTYPYFPNKLIEITTFEIKAHDSYGIEAVLEAAAHTLFANKSYLAIHYLNEDYENDTLITNLQKRCEMFGVGLIIFKDPDNWQTVTVITEAKISNPGPSEVNQFIIQQISEKNKYNLLSKMR